MVEHSIVIMAAVEIHIIDNRFKQKKKIELIAHRANSYNSNTFVFRFFVYDIDFLVLKQELLMYENVRIRFL